MSVISVMDLLSHEQPWDIGYVTKVSIPVSSLPAVALDLVSAPASQMYNEHIFSISSDIVAGETILRHHWSAECLKVKLEVSI